MTMKPCGPSSPCIRLIQGNERRHGALEDAQKSTYTTCPLNAVRSSRSSALAAPPMGDANTGTAGELIETLPERGLLVRRDGVFLQWGGGHGVRNLRPSLGRAGQRLEGI